MPKRKTVLFVMDIIGALMLGGGACAGLAFLLFKGNLIALVLGAIVGAGLGLLVVTEKEGKEK